MALYSFFLKCLHVLGNKIPIFIHNSGGQLGFLRLQTSWKEESRLKFSLMTRLLMVPKPLNSAYSVPCVWTQCLGSQGSSPLRFVSTAPTPLLVLLVSLCIFKELQLRLVNTAQLLRPGAFSRYCLNFTSAKEEAQDLSCEQTISNFIAAVRIADCCSILPWRHHK